MPVLVAHRPEASRMLVETAVELLEGWSGSSRIAGLHSTLERT